MTLEEDEINKRLMAIRKEILLSLCGEYLLTGKKYSGAYDFVSQDTIYKTVNKAFKEAKND